MAKIAVVITIIIGLAILSCNKKTKPLSGFRKLTIAIDTTINRTNAYNNLFIDSSVLERFITNKKLNDTLSYFIRVFYYSRNFEFAWFGSTGLIEQTYNFHSLVFFINNDYVPNAYLEKRINKLIVEKDSTISELDTAIVNTEIMISVRFIEYIMLNQTNIQISLADIGHYIPTKKTTVLEMARKILTDTNTKTASNNSYKMLKMHLNKYYIATKNGGWQYINSDSQLLKLGSIATEINLIKHRLSITGEFSSSDTSTLFNIELVNAVKLYQKNHCYNTTGIINAELINNLNIPAIVILQKILINMERIKWMSEIDNDMHIIVNIPEFELYVDSASSVLLKMDIIVGADGHNTTMFSGNMSHIVFSPYWKLPVSIIESEVIPGMKKDKNYLKRKRMEIIGHSNGLPEVRQLPGPKNSLGKVKFLFPNSFDIYLHDTPEKGFFKRTVRNNSSGCIRLSDASKMAKFIFRYSEILTPKRIDAAMNSGKEQYVKLQKPIRVLITYYTTWVDKKGTIHFANDIYGKDSIMAQKLFYANRYN